MNRDESLPDGSLGGAPRYRRARSLFNGVVGTTALLSLSGFLVIQTPVLWSEWKQLRRDWEIGRLGRPVGFTGISLDHSFANAPYPWFREEAGDLLLWSKWDQEKGHTWFRVPQGDIDVSQLELVLGRDVIRAIDRTVLEKEGGPIWGRMPRETSVASLEVGGVERAYPLLVLNQVMAVNDMVGGRPMLVLFTPFVAVDRSVDLFDPIFNGQRLTFGLSGYLLKPHSRPVLYDRQTESLWSMGCRQFTCLAGPLKGASLDWIGWAEMVPWPQWASEHPGGQLVVGAKRQTPTRPTRRSDVSPIPGDRARPRAKRPQMS